MSRAARVVGAVVALVALAFVTLAAGTASANIVEGPPPPLIIRAGVPSEIVLSSLGPGTSVQGSIGPVGSESDPDVAYPPDTTGFSPLDEGFAGVINANPPGGGPPTLSMYCIDIRTPTNIGYGYNLGTWDDANVTNAGYVARILNDYFPQTALPAIGSPGVADANARGAAVQAAIWYFSDNYVVAASDPKFPAVQAIVEAVRVQEPLPPPTAPTITIDPSSASGDAGSIVGPFTVNASVAGLEITLSAPGADLFLDAAGTQPVTAPVEPGTQFWVGSGTVQDVRVTASAEVEVPSGAAFLYSGNVENVDAAQKLILAQTITLDASTSAVVEFQEPPTTTSTTTTSSTVPATTVPDSTTTTTSTSTTSTSTSTSTTIGTTTTSVATATTTTDPGTLPSTGSNVGKVLLIAALVGFAGTAFVVAARRRHS